MSYLLVVGVATLVVGGVTLGGVVVLTLGMETSFVLPLVGKQPFFVVDVATPVVDGATVKEGRCCSYLWYGNIDKR